MDPEEMRVLEATREDSLGRAMAQSFGLLSLFGDMPLERGSESP
jgi:hypothetical protein